MKTMPKKGMRVRIKSINAKGKITYVDKANLTLDHFRPVQITLDKPFDPLESGHKNVNMYRTHVKDLVKLKKKKKAEDVIIF